MKCWPGCASEASMMMWYSVTACASFGRERSLRSSSAIVSSRSNTFLKPQVRFGRVAASEPAMESPASTTSRMKRPKKTAWRASSTCWVARKYFCSSRGAASMNGDRLSATESSPWKNIE